MNKTLRTTWSGSLQGNGKITGDTLDIPIAIPVSYGGCGTGADPKDLLVSSAAACFSMTAIAMLEASKFPVHALDMKTEASDAEDGEFQIVHHLQLTLSEDATAEQVRMVGSIIHSAEKKCSVGNMLRKAGINIGIQLVVF
ncbi:OsmC family protein [Salmonella enterica]